MGLRSVEVVVNRSSAVFISAALMLVISIASLVVIWVTLIPD